MTDAPSLILALHARYEQAWDEYNQLDNAKPGDADPPAPAHSRKIRIEEAMEANQREVDALRQALLYQVPNTSDEALVLACHLHTTFGLTEDFDKAGDVDRLAFETGLDTLLDFMFGESSFTAGYQLKQAERIVQSRRRLRTGVTEETDD
jgi:hypothetical protein